MKLKAFTIMELVMAMALVAIIAGLGYAAWGILDNNLNSYSKTSSELLEGTNCAVFLERDFKLAKKIIIKENKLQMEMQDVNLVYIFEEKQIRRLAVLDEISESTFHVMNASFESYFQGKYITDGLINHCTIKMNIAGEENTVHLQKEYSSDELIRYLEYVD